MGESGAGVAAPSVMEAVLGRQESRESAARTYARSLPIVPVSARGTKVTGADGRTYLDCLCGAGTLALGHNHPVVIEAIRGALERGIPLHTLDLGTPEKDDFTGALLDRLPEPLRSEGRVHFCGPTGADAVEASLKLCLQGGGRTFLAFTGAYHGMTLGALAVSSPVAVKGPLAASSAEVVRLPYPYSYHCPFGLGGDACGRASAAHVERLLDDPLGGVASPAAMIVEAVQGEGGVIDAPDSWLREMRRVTSERGIPLIVDEVQTGAGRTGAMWAIEHSGIVPDVLVLSKAIGGGLPLAVIVYRPGLDRWAAGAHTGTFRGNQLAFVAGAATLRHIAAEGLAERADRLGGRLRRDLESLAAGHPCIAEVRGRGLMLGLELVRADAAPDPIGSRPADPGLAVRVREECLRRGLMLELGGRHDAVVRLLPPLTISDAEADSVVERLAGAVTAAEAGR
ncbi:MAG TPA: diaminobutyrate--2-oxoglutarate transaminase family protein [Candidatus Dormibacteraeota bacterium]|nr:diaminobutyrate--2-oxoglutarate transaminase family protein [Candidatus Dormibacteraeota bacterium]